MLFAVICKEVSVEIYFSKEMKMWYLSKYNIIKFNKICVILFIMQWIIASIFISTPPYFKSNYITLCNVIIYCGNSESMWNICRYVRQWNIYSPQGNIFKHLKVLLDLPYSSFVRKITVYLYQLFLDWWLKRGHSGMERKPSGHEIQLLVGEWKKPHNILSISTSVLLSFYWNIEYALFILSSCNRVWVG